MPQIPDNNAMAWETVGLPLARGVDLRTPGRAIPQQRLITFENGRFSDADAGLERRRGHDEYVVNQVEKTVPFLGTPEWVYGAGWMVDGVLVDRPQVAQLHGLAQRDTEVLAWDGHQLLSWPPTVGDNAPWQIPGGSAVMPHARTFPVAKEPISQQHCDLGVGRGIAVVAWIDVAASTARISVFDAKTWAPLLTNKALAFTNASGIRVVPAGDWVHVLVSSTTELSMFSIHESDTQTVRSGLTAFGSCNVYFDARRISDDKWIVAKRDTLNGAYVTYLNNDGSADTTFFGANTKLNTDPADGDQNVERIACDVHPLTGEIALVWRPTSSAAKVLAAVYTPEGVLRGSRQLVYSTGNSILQVSVTGVYQRYGNDPTYGMFQWYAADDRVVAGDAPRVHTATLEGSTGSGPVTTRYWVTLSHHAFRVGAKPFAVVRYAYKNGDTAVRLQRTHFVVDADLKSVGALERGTSGDGAVLLRSVHPYDGQDVINRARLHLAVPYRQRLDSESNDQFDEHSIKLGELNFLPKLRSAQLGRTLYIAGAQLHQYDGRQVVEAGMQIFPEKVNGFDNGAGNISGTVRYRARWAWKNAQGEEEVSPYLYSNEVGPLTNRQVRVTIRTHGLTRKEGVYLLLYRNEGTDPASGAPGTQWYLVTSRDPADSNYVKNDPSVAEITFDDNISNTDILAYEKDRADGSLLEPFAAPASEVIAAGRDRLWLAGGEIPSGSFQPSLTHSPGEVAAFNTYLQTVVDQAPDPVTAFAFMQHSTLVFRPTRIFAFEADGPNNQAIGSFDFPRAIATDVGAADQASIAVSTAGVFFQSLAGPRLLATNYQVIDIGAAVRPVAQKANVTAAVIVPGQRELRFYCADGPALVYFYENGEWATWPGLEAVGAVLYGDGVVLGRSDGKIWVERDGVWTDGGRGYEMVVRTASLNRGVMQGAQRVRRVAVLGDVFGACKLKFRVYLDDNPSPADEWSWDLPGPDLNPTVLGDGATLGDGGFLGDFTASGLSVPRTRVLGDRRRLAVQKCSRISIEIRDGAPSNQGVGMTELALELGARGGLARVPERTHS